MKIFDEDIFDIVLFNIGIKQVKKEGGFFSSLEKSILSGLINALSNLILNSEIFNKIINNIFGNETNGGKNGKYAKKKTIVKILEMIVDFFLRNKKRKSEIKDEKTEYPENTLTNNGNIEIEDLKEENQMLKNQIYVNSQKLEKLIDILMYYMDNDRKKLSGKDNTVSNTFISKEKIQYNF